MRCNRGSVALGSGEGRTLRLIFVLFVSILSLINKHLSLNYMIFVLESLRSRLILVATIKELNFNKKFY